jgi:hypothetical protein
MRMLAVIAAMILTGSVSAPAIEIGETAPAFSALTYRDGLFDLEAQKGKVTVLMFLCYI